MLTSTFSQGVSAALVAAFLFGVSGPAAKSLLAKADPLVLGAILYLGAGLGLTALRAVLPEHRTEAALRRADLPFVLGMTVAGGVLAPLLLLEGLRRIPAVTGSLLLNLEGVFTVLLAVAFFGEHLGVRAAVAATTMILAAALLGMTSRLGMTADSVGIVAVAGACLAWAADNNLTQRISLRDPLMIAQVKGTLGGTIALAVGLALGHPMPPAAVIGLGLVVGFFSYGLSVVLAVYSMREIGVAREAALFSTAPFLGVVISVALLHEAFGTREVVAMLLMVVGVVLLASEQHSHRHVHEPIQHDHRHVHDEHHRHVHAPGDPPGDPHTHEHAHEELDHDHPHTQDVHHRHH